VAVIVSQVFGGLTLLLLTYLVGSWLERRHYRDILKREYDYRDMPICNFEYEPEDAEIEAVVLAKGSVVISVDYFKRFIAMLKAIVGGRIGAYAPLLDRARREAVLRMIEDARAQGCDTVVNVRLETFRLANATRNRRERLAGVEMLAYGTGLKLTRRAISG
jgi:uncharacterized protein YbjQ (UPF0145 family)